jgi:hypothetical protein
VPAGGRRLRLWQGKQAWIVDYSTQVGERSAIDQVSALRGKDIPPIKGVADVG